MNRQQFNAMVAQYGIENISGSDVVAWSSGVPCNVQSMKLYGKCEQSATPTPDAPVEIKCNGGSYRYTSTGDSFDITVPELRGIGEYKDEWDYVTGKGIRRIGERVLKGTEGWIKYHWGDGQGFYSYRLEIKSFNTSGEKCICTHYAPLSGYASLYYGRVEGAYVGTVADDKSWLVIGNSFPTVSEFKAFLAEQYANGTPVTVYYAMAEPQEFYEAGGSLSNLSGRIEPKNVPVTGVDLKAKCVNHSMFSGEKKIVTVSGTDYVEWSGGEMHRNLPSLKFYGGRTTSGTPTPEAPVDMRDHIGVYMVNGSQDYIRLPNLRCVGAKYTSLGIVRDEWDYVTGKGTRRIKKIVADGETIKVDYASSKSGRITLTEPGLAGNSGATAVLCTHFNTAWNTNPGSIYILNTNIVVMSMSGGLSVGDWNTWLKAQKEAGTPVIIYYALKEPIPFEERPQPYVPIPNDSGNIQFVDGNVSGVPFELTYITHS